MSDQELEAKFLKQIDKVLAPQQARKLLDQLWNIEKLNDLSVLFSLMKVPEAA